MHEKPSAEIKHSLVQKKKKVLCCKLKYASRTDFSAIQFDQQRLGNKCFVSSLTISSAISSELKFSKDDVGRNYAVP